MTKARVRAKLTAFGMKVYRDLGMIGAGDSDSSRCTGRLLTICHDCEREMGLRELGYEQGYEPVVNESAGPECDFCGRDYE